MLFGQLALEGGGDNTPLLSVLALLTLARCAPLGLDASM